jgi:hypothetical protein
MRLPRRRLRERTWDTISHPDRGHDDAANAVAGVAALSKFGGYDTSMRWDSGDDNDAWTVKTPGWIPLIGVWKCLISQVANRASVRAIGGSAGIWIIIMLICRCFGSTKNVVADAPVQ